jgi:polysaccharide biosynthesis protein PelC
VWLKKILPGIVLVLLTACTSSPLSTYHDSNMDFGSIQTVAVLPFANLTGHTKVEDRVRDVFMNMLLATSSLYVLPPGEVARGIARVQLVDGTAPSAEEIQKLGVALNADAIITGVVREYGEVRSGTAASNVISIGVQMMEAQTGRVIWSGSTTKGGITMEDRLLGGGGQPMNDITEEAVRDLIHQLFNN